jgi:hypothetical protein
LAPNHLTARFPAILADREKTKFSSPAWQAAYTHAQCRLHVLSKSPGVLLDDAGQYEGCRHRSCRIRTMTGSCHLCNGHCRALAIGLSRLLPLIAGSQEECLLRTLMQIALSTLPRDVGFYTQAWRMWFAMAEGLASYTLPPRARALRTFSQGYRFLRSKA